MTYYIHNLSKAALLYPSYMAFECNKNVDLTTVPTVPSGLGGFANAGEKLKTRLVITISYFAFVLAAQLFYHFEL